MEWEGWDLGSGDEVHPGASGGWGVAGAGGGEVLPVPTGGCLQVKRSKLSGMQVEM